MPQLMRLWFELWQTPKLAPLATAHPRVLLKPQRLYLMQGLGAAKRWEILHEHYAFAAEYFQAAALREIFTGPGILLATLPVTETGHSSLRLLYDDLFEKEGELSLVFCEERERRPIVTLTFCVSCRHPERREVFIGGLQGNQAANGREYIVSLTRGMYGLRPKALLLFALQQFAALWNVRSLRAVSNANRACRHPSSIKADYDAFWADSGGQMQADGNYTLPIRFVAREMAGIRPNKRTMYRHRYQMLNDLGAQLRQTASRLEDSVPVAALSTGVGPASRVIC